MKKLLPTTLLLIAALLVLGMGCQKEIHEVRHTAPQGTLACAQE